MDSSAVAEALTKLVAALKKVRVQAVAIGDGAARASGCARDVQGLELLSGTNEKQRLTILAAAKSEGLTALDAPAGTSRFQHKAVPLRMIEASTPYLRQVLSRALPGVVAGVRSLVATPEDLVLLRAGSDAPADRERVIELFKTHGGKLDAEYLRIQAEAAKIFDNVKALWRESRT